MIRFHRIKFLNIVCVLGIFFGSTLFGFSASKNDTVPPTAKEIYQTNNAQNDYHKPNLDEVPPWLTSFGIIASIFGLAAAIFGLAASVYLSKQTDKKLEKSLAQQNQQLQDTLKSNSELLKEVLNNNIVNGLQQTTSAINAIRDQSNAILSIHSESARDMADKTAKALDKMQQLWRETHEIVYSISETTNRVERDFSTLQVFVSNLNSMSGVALQGQGKKTAKRSSKVERNVQSTTYIIENDKLRHAIKAAMSKGVSYAIAVELLRQMWSEQGKYKFSDIEKQHYPQYANAINEYIKAGILTEQDGFIFVAKDMEIDLNNLFVTS